MSTSPILHGKHAVVFAAGGSAGSAIAREFAAEGAEVHLCGRTQSSVDDLAQQITTAGGRAHAAVVDALDEAAVDHYLDRIAQDTGRIDIVFNAIGPLAAEYGNGKPAVALTVEEFITPLTHIVRSQFLTARAAARHMTPQGSGVIMFLTGSPARPHGEGTSAIGAAFAAMENLTRHLALELGTAGVRVVCLRTAAMPDTRTIQDTMRSLSAQLHLTQDQALQRIANLTMLKVSPRTSDTAKVAAFLACDSARMMTGTVVNASAGAVSD